MSAVAEKAVEGLVAVPERFTRAEDRSMPTMQPVDSSPMNMLAVAVQKGMDPATIKDLMDLQERWEKAQAKKAFDAALAAFKANPPELRKNKHVAFDTSKGRTEYDHATLDHVSVEIGKALAPHGLSHRWNVEQLDGGQIRVTCILAHSAGHSESVPMQAGRDDSGSKNNIQGLGSTVTYLQRYTLLAITGMAVKGQDNDGAGGGGGDDTMPGLSDKAYADHIAAIDSAADLDALQKAYTKAVSAADAAKDKAAKRGFIDAKDKRKAALGAKK